MVEIVPSPKGRTRLPTEDDRGSISFVRSLTVAMSDGASPTTYASSVTDAPTPAEVPRPARKPWVAHAIWAGVVLIPLLVITFLISLTTLPEGQCSGLGWGCNVAGAEAAGIFFIFIGIPILLVWLVGHAVIALIQWLRRRRARSALPSP